jgi:23S rRNA (cytidine1920-2'-O)/16S rRNA (cytidine1409-2'-O)-methyltransferase
LRADLWLVQAGLAPTRTAAQRLIQAGSVQFHANRLVRKAGELVNTDQTLTLVSSAEIAFVSRAGLKLQFGLQHFNISVTGLRCLDIGQSTGGFTDCLLQQGAKSVVGVDVGHSQLHEKIRSDPRVTVFEKLNIRDLAALTHLTALAHFDIAVVDVSFISLAKVLPNVLSLLQPSGLLIALFKPQFEVGVAHIGKGGIVKNLQVVQQTLECCLLQYQTFSTLVGAPVKALTTGADGNQEYLLVLKPALNSESL